ncbi:MAG: hypothetical protein IKU37_07910 [Candidatus Gastranaerophilales bacterium]|nr:hypothetical protein [Candidatus Gastranaerophilales bacterium]
MKYAKIIIPVLYLIFSLIISFNRVPFWDEARAWLVAQNCSPLEFLNLMKLECHFSLWYIAIFPFAKLNLFYPYSIYILNALFAFVSICLLWNKSPFNAFQKILITFGVPFLFLWGSVARCYSIGIMFLFLALSIYKERFEKSYKYLILLCLSAHTSVMAFIGSFFLLLIFLFENFKKKQFLKLLGIFLLSNFLILLQIYDPNPDYLKQAPEMAFLRDFIWYLLNPVVIISQYKIQSLLMTILRLSVIVTAFVYIGYVLKSNKKNLFFIFSTYFSMVILFTFFYSGNFWHYFYFYLYFIVATWILKFENKSPMALNTMITIILIMFMFKGSLFIDSKLSTVNNSTSNLIAIEIQKNYKGKKLFCLDPWSDIAPSALPYLKEIDIFDKYNQNRKSFESMRSQIRFNREPFDPDEFAKYVEKDSILLTTTSFLNHELKNPKRKFDEKTGVVSFIGNKKTIEFIPYKFMEEICLWTYLIKVK